MRYLLVIILNLLLPLSVFAQQEPTTTETPTTTSTPTFEYFNVKVYPASQSAWNKKVTVYVEFQATINSDKVQIEWDVPSGITIEPKYPAFFSVKSGQTYKYKALITPKTSGTYNIAANVISWQYNTNYTSSGNSVITFDDQLLTKPVMASYSTGVIVKWVTIVGAIGILGYIGVIYAIKSKKKFDRWFNLPD